MTSRNHLSLLWLYIRKSNLRYINVLNYSNSNQIRWSLDPVNLKKYLWCASEMLNQVEWLFDSGASGRTCFNASAERERNCGSAFKLVFWFSLDGDGGEMRRKTKNMMLLSLGRLQMIYLFLISCLFYAIFWCFRNSCKITKKRVKLHSQRVFDIMMWVVVLKTN